MSDLNNFFAKRDRKKKKGAARGAAVPATTSSSRTTAASTGTDRQISSASGSLPQAASQKQTDDGWIDIDDPKSAQVNTGGRTVGQFKRGVEDKEQTGDHDTPTEKFSGWTMKQDQPKPEPVAEPEDKNKLKIRKAWKPAGPDVSSAALFPSLKDTADAPQVPVGFKTSGSTSGGAGMAGRPRFVNSRAGSGGPGTSGSRPRFVNSNPNKFAGLERDN